MATAVTPALAVANIVILFTTPSQVKGQLKSLTIDNQGAANHTITIRDDFTTDATAALAATPETIRKGQWTVGAGLCAVISKDELASKEILGVCKCYADGAEPNCIITVDYDFA